MGEILASFPGDRMVETLSPDFGGVFRADGRRAGPVCGPVLLSPAAAAGSMDPSAKDRFGSTAGGDHAVGRGMSGASPDIPATGGIVKEGRRFTISPVRAVAAARLPAQIARSALRVRHTAPGSRIIRTRRTD